MSNYFKASGPKTRYTIDFDTEEYNRLSMYVRLNTNHKTLASWVRETLAAASGGRVPLTADEVRAMMLEAIQEASKDAPANLGQGLPTQRPTLRG